MNEKLQKIIVPFFLILVLILVVLVAAAFWNIHSMKKNLGIDVPVDRNQMLLSGEREIAQENDSGDSFEEIVKNNFIDGAHILTGNIAQVAGQSITVQADIYDLEKADIGQVNGGAYTVTDRTPKLNKKFTLNLNSQTKMNGGIKPDSLKVGMKLMAKISESFYETDNLTAIEISILRQ